MARATKLATVEVTLLVRRKWLVGSVAFACLAVVSYDLMLPWLAGKRVISALDDRGFSEASIGAVQVGVGHVRVDDVKLVDGVKLGTVELDRGLSLLWGDIGEITVHDAQLTTGGLTRAARQYRRTSGHGSFRSLRVIDSALAIGKTPTAISGTVVAAPGALDITVSIRDPSVHGWNAHLRGRVSLGKQIELQAGQVDVTVPERAVGPAKVTNATVTAEVSGTLSPLDLRVRGVARAERVVVADIVELTNASVPFRFATADGLHVSAVASAYGGTLTLDPLVIDDAGSELTIHARGLDLARVFRAVGHGHVSGTGSVDGALALRLDSQRAVVDHASFRSRAGTIRVLDERLAGRVAQQSKLAVHERIAAALRDFQFDQLSVELAPRETNPELRVALRGRGRRNHQELDIAIMMRGVRLAAQRLLHGVI